MPKIHRRRTTILSYAIWVALSVAALACSVLQSIDQFDNQLFADDFSQDNELWETFDTDTAKAAIIDGAMVLDVLTPSTVAYSLAPVHLDDFDLTVLTTQESGSLENGYGVLFRYIDENNFYRFDISGDGLWGITRRAGNEWIGLTELSPSAAIRPGLSSNVLRVVAEGDQFTFYVNNEVLAQVTDANLPVGRAGLFASTFGDSPTRIRFDNLTIIKP